MRFNMKNFLSIILVFTSSAVLADIETTADVIYGHKDGMALVYDVITPENANGAAIVYIVSAGWFSQWAPPETRVEQFSYLLDAGYILIPVHHGSAPRYLIPDAYADVSRALRHIKLNATAYGVDADKVGVLGMSAGGHLALMLGMDSDSGDPDSEDEVMRHDNNLAAVVAYKPPTDITRIVGPTDRFPALDFPSDLAASVSPALHVSGEDPPTLLVHGDQDTLVPIQFSEFMLAKLNENSIDSELITITGGRHAPFSGEHLVQATSATLDWFNKYLLGVDTGTDD